MSTESPGPRRSTHSEMPMAYGAIGASAAPDLLRFPPADSTPYEESVQLGSGSERFLTAANLLMTWGAQRVAGVDVIDIEAGDAGEYAGIVFAEDGTPELGASPEDLFTPEGEPYLLPGTTASFVVPGKEPRRIMVVSTVVESTALGFSWGDRDQVPGFGEQQIVVEHRPDGTVWAVVRGFAFASATGLLAGRKEKTLKREIMDLAKSFVAALEPGAALRAEDVAQEESAQDAPTQHDSSQQDPREASEVVEGEIEPESNESIPPASATEE